MPPKRTTTPMSDVAIKVLVARSVADALAEHEANRSRNGDDSHDSGTSSRRTERAAREYTCIDFLKCQPLNFKMMTDKYCLRGKIKKLEIELWNMKVKGQEIRTFADRQAANKRKLDDNSRSNQNQQQPFKKQNVARAYTLGPGNSGATSRAYVVGNAGKNSDANVVT
ncbi:hypothetical protein Tco_0501744, partial [Tanacetum coccineum]